MSVETEMTKNNNNNNNNTNRDTINRYWDVESLEEAQVEIVDYKNL